MSEQTGMSRVLKPVLISVALGAAVCIGVLLLISLVLSTQSVPQSMVSPMAIFAVSLGALVSGYCCAKIMRQNGLAYGAVCGAAFSVVVMLASLSISDNGFGTLAIFKIIFMLFSAMLGGILGVNTRQRRKK